MRWLARQKKMGEYRSDDGGADCSIEEKEVNKSQISDKFKNLFGELRVQVYKGDPGERTG